MLLLERARAERQKVHDGGRGQIQQVLKVVLEMIAALIFDGVFKVPC